MPSPRRSPSSYDNALAEAFFATLKRELDVDHRRWATEADARRDVFRWIAFYNHRRRHSTLGYLPGRCQVMPVSRYQPCSSGYRGRTVVCPSSSRVIRS